MRLPKKVQVNGKPWKVWEVPRVSKGDLGKADAQKREILIKKNQSDHEKKVTLVHEMMHGFMWFLDESCVEQIANDVVDALEDCDE